MRFQLLPFVLVAALAAAGLPGCSSTNVPSPPAPTFTVKLIGFNDYHGHLQSPGSFGVNAAVPAASRPAVGGADYLAAYVERMKSANPLNVVVGAGDFIGASPLVSALFHDEPAVETLNHIGVEFNAVGNHEFDKGRTELLRLQNGGCKQVNGATDPNSCRGLGSARPGAFDGAKFQWLSANVVDTASGRTLLPAYGIKEFNGVKVAFIGMTLKGTPGIVSPAGVAGLAFRDEADTVNALVPGLRAQGIEAIVVLLHQGGTQGGGLGDINGCVDDLRNADGSDSELGKIVRRLDDAVDLVVSGHTHAAYNCSAHTVDVTGTAAAPVSTPRATGLPNAAGRLVPATSAGALGRVLTDIDITIDPNRRDIVAVSPRNVLVDRTEPGVTASALLKRVVDGYAALVAPVSAQVVGHIARALPAVADAAGEMPAGNLIADAQLAATQPAALGGAEIAFMNPGGVRSSGFDIAGATYPYAVSYGDAFTVQPFGNTLMTLNLTAQQLKNLLEQQFAGCQGQATTRILQVSNGFRFTWKASAPACAKVTDARLTRLDLNATPPAALAAEEVIVAGGVVLNPSKAYRVTVNNFIQSGGDGFTVLAGGTNAMGGGQDIDALVAYLGKFKAPLGAYEPAGVGFNIPRISVAP